MHVKSVSGVDCTLLSLSYMHSWLREAVTDWIGTWSVLLIQIIGWPILRQIQDFFNLGSNILSSTHSDHFRWAQLNKTYATQFFPNHRGLFGMFKIFSGLVIDDGRIFLVRLGCQVGKVTAPRRRRQPHPTRTCSYFAYDKVLGLPKFSYRQSLAYGHRRARDRSTKVVRLG